MKLKVGYFVFFEHKNDKSKKSYHPFLIINLTQKNIYGVQCATVKNRDNNSHFSRNNISYYNLRYSYLKFVTHIRLDEISKLFLTKETKFLDEIHYDDYFNIVNKLYSAKWKNTPFSNDKEIKRHIKQGYENFNTIWDCQN